MKSGVQILQLRSGQEILCSPQNRFGRRSLLSIYQKTDAGVSFLLIFYGEKGGFDFVK